MDNTKNGPDRIVDGNISIQTKYYSTSKGTVNAAFDSVTKQYRYPGQQLEVPSDQFDECINLMKDKINAGLVKNAEGNTITDPEEAYKIIRKGSVTYQQAKNIAKAGNIDSLIFDVKNNVITTGYVGGIAFLVSFARYKWSGTNTKNALKCALSDALQSGGIAMLTGVLSSQFMRCRSAAGLTVLMRPGVRAVYHSSKFGKVAIEKLASAAAGKALSGAAAINSVAKLLRSNIVTSCVSTAVITAPDFYRAVILKNVSWAQFGKNLAVNASGVAGGVGGWMAGAAAGAAAGSVIPGVGNVIGGVIGGILGALGGGTLASMGAKAGLDHVIKDDAEEMLELLQDVFTQLCFDYLLSEEEANQALSRLQSTINDSWLRDMYGFSETNTGRKNFASTSLEPEFESIIRNRPRISPPTAEEMDAVLEDLANAAEEMDTVLEEQANEAEKTKTAFGDMAKTLGISESAVEILYFLKEHGSSTFTTIKNELNKDKIFDDIDELIQKGYITLYNSVYSISYKALTLLLVDSKYERIVDVKEIPDLRFGGGVISDIRGDRNH